MLNLNRLFSSISVEKIEEYCDDNISQVIIKGLNLEFENFKIDIDFLKKDFYSEENSKLREVYSKACNQAEKDQLGREWYSDIKTEKRNIPFFDWILSDKTKSRIISRRNNKKLSTQNSDKNSSKDENLSSKNSDKNSSSSEDESSNLPTKNYDKIPSLSEDENLSSNVEVSKEKIESSTKNMVNKINTENRDLSQNNISEDCQTSQLTIIDNEDSLDCDSSLSTIVKEQNSLNMSDNKELHVMTTDYNSLCKSKSQEPSINKTSVLYVRWNCQDKYFYQNEINSKCFSSKKLDDKNLLVKERMINHLAPTNVFFKNSNLNNIIFQNSCISFNRENHDIIQNNYIRPLNFCLDISYRKNQNSFDKFSKKDLPFIKTVKNNNSPITIDELENKNKPIKTSSKNLPDKSVQSLSNFKCHYPTHKSKCRYNDPRCHYLKYLSNKNSLIKRRMCEHLSPKNVSFNIRHYNNILFQNWYTSFNRRNHNHISFQKCHFKPLKFPNNTDYSINMISKNLLVNKKPKVKQKNLQKFINNKNQIFLIQNFQFKKGRCQIRIKAIRKYEVTFGIGIDLCRILEERISLLEERISSIYFNITSSKLLIALSKNINYKTPDSYICDHEGGLKLSTKDFCQHLTLETSFWWFPKPFAENGILTKYQDKKLFFKFYIKTKNAKINEKLKNCEKKEKILNNQLQRKMNSFQNKIMANICSNTLWKRKQHIIKLPFKTRLRGNVIKDLFKPRNSSLSFMAFYKDYIVGIKRYSKPVIQNKILRQNWVRHPGHNKQDLINSPWSHAAFYTEYTTDSEKKVLRLVTNHNPLKPHFKWIRHPFPNKQDLWQEEKIFLKFDLKSDFLQIHLPKEVEYKSSFTPFYRHFEWGTMSFGLNNAHSKFQNFMDQGLSPYSNFFSDVVLIYPHNIKQRWKHWKFFIKTIRKKNLVISRRKKDLFQTKVLFLDFRIKIIFPKVRSFASIFPNFILEKQQLQKVLGCSTYVSDFYEHYIHDQLLLKRLYKKPPDWNKKLTKAIQIVTSKDKTLHLLLLACTKVFKSRQINASDTSYRYTLLHKPNNLEKSTSDLWNQTLSILNKDILANVLGIDRFQNNILNKKILLRNTYTKVKHVLEKDIQNLASKYILAWWQTIFSIFDIKSNDNCFPDFYLKNFYKKRAGLQMNNHLSLTNYLCLFQIDRTLRSGNPLQENPKTIEEIALDNLSLCFSGMEGLSNFSGENSKGFKPRRNRRRRKNPIRYQMGKQSLLEVTRKNFQFPECADKISFKEKLILDNFWMGRKVSSDGMIKRTTKALNFYFEKINVLKNEQIDIVDNIYKITKKEVISTEDSQNLHNWLEKLVKKIHFEDCENPYYYHDFSKTFLELTEGKEGQELKSQHVTTRRCLIPRYKDQIIKMVELLPDELQEDIHKITRRAEQNWIKDWDRMQNGLWISTLSNSASDHYNRYNISSDLDNPRTTELFENGFIHSLTTHHRDNLSRFPQIIQRTTKRILRRRFTFEAQFEVISAPPEWEENGTTYHRSYHLLRYHGESFLWSQELREQLNVNQGTSLYQVITVADNKRIRANKLAEIDILLKDVTWETIERSDRIIVQVRRTPDDCDHIISGFHHTSQETQEYFSKMKWFQDLQSLYEAARSRGT